MTLRQVETFDTMTGKSKYEEYVKVGMDDIAICNANKINISIIVSYIICRGNLKELSDTCKTTEATIIKHVRKAKECGLFED